MLVIQAACDDSERPRLTEIQHPVVDSVVTRVSRMQALERELPPADDLASFGRRLEEMQSVMTVGVLTEPEEEVLGEILDGWIDAQDRVWILDGKFNAVHVFTSTGEPLTTVAGPGRGPGELYRPLALAIDSENLYVSQFDRSLNKYRLADNGAAFVERISTGISAQEMCLRGSDVVLQGVPVEGGATIFALDSTAFHPFGAIYRSTNPLVFSELSRGRIACSHDRIVLGPQAVVNRIYGFSDSGDAVWETSFPDFKPIETIEDLQRRSFRVRIDDGGFHRLESLTMHPDGWVVAQLAFVSQDDAILERGVSRLDTFVIDAATGAGGLLTSELPRIIAMTRNHALAVEDGLIPAVGLYRLGG